MCGQAYVVTPKYPLALYLWGSVELVGQRKFSIYANDKNKH